MGRKLRSSLKNQLKNSEYTVTVEFDNRKSKNEKEKVVVHDNIESTIKISRVDSIKKLFHTPLVSRKKISKETTTNNLDDDNDTMKLKMKLYNINNNDSLAIEKQKDDNKSNSPSQSNSKNER